MSSSKKSSSGSKAYYSKENIDELKSRMSGSAVSGSMTEEEKVNLAKRYINKAKAEYEKHKELYQKLGVAAGVVVMTIAISELVNKRNKGAYETLRYEGLIPAMMVVAKSIYGFIADGASRAYGGVKYYARKSAEYLGLVKKSRKERFKERVKRISNRLVSVMTNKDETNKKSRK